MNPDKLIQAAMNGHSAGPHQVQLATPINDVQLVALIAAEVYDGESPAAVEVAMDLFAETIAQMGPNGQNLVRLIQAKIALRREAN